MEFHKKIKLEIQDYISLNMFSLRKLLILIIILVIVLPLPFLYITNHFELPTFSDFIITFIATVVIMALLILFVIARMRRNLKKQYNSTKIMQAENEYVINDTGLFISGEYGNTNMKWPDIVKIAESKEAIYIFITKGQAFIIPKRYLDPEEEKTLRAILQKSFPASKIHQM